MRPIARTVATASAAAALLGSTALAANAAAATPIKSGSKTVITLDATALRNVQAAGVKIQAISPATLVGGTLTLPTASGTATPPNYVEAESGGIVISRAGQTVKFTEITLRTASHVAWVNVTGHGRIAALTLGDPQMGNGGPGFVMFGAYPVSFTPAAVRAIDSALHTTLFSKRPTLGLGASTVRF